MANRKLILPLAYFLSLPQALRFPAPPHFGFTKTWHPLYPKLTSELIKAISEFQDYLSAIQD
ncbi:hypothetical protein BVRB_7g168010 isoform B [Beta vulgaris subsp. vulgaris]|nr:hypothetical protein BVRB_7g168010 isoform B [Beta vulgaris subsp. vulgaris]